ncbi:MAG: EpsG family protein [Sphingomicrobium sp.]
MLPYWGLLIVLALVSILPRKANLVPDDGRMALRPLKTDVPLVSAALVILLMVGLRYNVGGDWRIYFAQYRMISNSSLDVVGRLNTETGYTLLNWLAGKLGFGFWFVNLVCAIPFVWGLILLARQQPNPWLALVVATPVLIILVGMGYTRQSVGVGCMLIGLTGLMNGKGFLWFVAWVLVGALCHKSALLFIPLVALFIFEWRFSTTLLLLATGLIGYFVVLPETLDRYAAGYINTVYEAKGVVYRVIPNAVAGAILLLFRKQFTGLRIELRIWRGFAFLSLLAVVALLYVRSTVIIDRLSLYVLPMQIVVLSTLPAAFGRKQQESLAVTGLVITYSAVQLFIWLNYANHSRFWVPYRFYPLSS